ncbi:hypothetical protein Dimus_016708 [Dionaea muscipula]
MDRDTAFHIFKEVFKIGAKVEARFDDEYGRGIWYSATVLDEVRGDLRVGVKFTDLLFADNRRFCQIISAALVRPKPPSEPPGTRSFSVNDVVDAFHDHGWREGRVEKILEDSRYEIFSESIGLRLPFHAAQIRVHREWKPERGHAEWDPPLIVAPQQDHQESSEVVPSPTQEASLATSAVSTAPLASSWSSSENLGLASSFSFSSWLPGEDQQEANRSHYSWLSRWCCCLLFEKMRSLARDLEAVVLQQLSSLEDSAFHYPAHCF